MLNNTSVKGYLIKTYCLTVIFSILWHLWL